MAVLEALVIATIILAGAWVGYNAWQESLHHDVEKHDIDLNLDIFSDHVLNHNNISIISKSPLVH
ncbi:MAG: hypothetical protein R3327_06015 [Nitrosopumilaceae archaeon]|nr:hypothetical protein [Nitrosopumilaceae archaeon]